MATLVRNKPNFSVPGKAIDGQRTDPAYPSGIKVKQATDYRPADEQVIEDSEKATKQSQFEKAVTRSIVKELSTTF